MDKFWENYIKTRPADSKGAFDAFKKMNQEPRIKVAELDNFNTPDLEQSPDSFLKPGETLEDWDVTFRRPNAQGGRIGFQGGLSVAKPLYNIAKPLINPLIKKYLPELGALTSSAILALRDRDEEVSEDLGDQITTKVEKDAGGGPKKEPPQYPYDPEEDLIKKTLEEILRDRIRAEEKKQKDRQIFDERMHGEAGGKGTFTGSGTERKSIPPPGFTPKDKSTLTLFRNNKNLEGLETKNINSLMEFRKNPELFYERVKDLKARGVDFDALYNPAEIAELLGLKTASGITDAIVSKNIPFEKIGAFKAVKLSDYLNSQIATIEKFKDVPLKGKEDAQRGDVMDEFEKGSIYSRFKKLRQPKFLPEKVLEIYKKYNFC